jgi:RNA-directed DNA polymerase
VKAEANPFDPRFKEYFKEREKKIRKANMPITVATAGLNSISLMRA